MALLLTLVTSFCSAIAIFARTADRNHGKACIYSQSSSLHQLQGHKWVVSVAGQDKHAVPRNSTLPERVPLSQITDTSAKMGDDAKSKTISGDSGIPIAILATGLQDLEGARFPSPNAS